ncbi:MAG: hypothetical protein ACJ743_13010 [Gaiellaceae bacterium]
MPLPALIAVTAVWGVTFVQAEAPLAVPTKEDMRASPACPS